MTPLLLAFAFQLAASTPADDGYGLVNPKAIELFEADSRLMQWALAKYDSDSDGHLSIFEADKAARAFKAIADGDGDGRVTTAEYSAARDFIVARWAVNSSQPTRR
jgi:hypothetical protein